MRMRPLLNVLMCFPAVLFATAPAPAGPQADRGKTLWTIGKADGSGAEFALAPGGWSKFDRDGYFIVGRSDPKRDWPYIQPGPGDAWIGGRSHTFTVAFGVKAPVPSAGTCRLELALVDTQSGSPPTLRIALNGQAETRLLPPGGGDASINGHPEAGKPYRLEVNFPATALKVGANVLTITTVSGSWILYDRLALVAPAVLDVAPAEGTLVVDLEALPFLKSQGDKLVRPAKLSVCHLGESTVASIRVGQAAPARITLATGRHDYELLLPEATSGTVPVVVEAAGKTLASVSLAIRPARKLTVYLLPHSHTDIGYTEIQTRIEQKQVDNLLQGIAHAKRTASYPEGARFVWNVEVLWAADLYLNRLSEAQRSDFVDAVKKGQVSLNGMYLNELTGLCRPEELLRLFRFATVLSQQTGVPIDSAMISDVPGYTWGTVTAMAQGGIKYFSTAPNYLDRIGDILLKWENRPFYWVSPSGKDKVLVWIPLKGYALSHILGSLRPQWVGEYLAELEKMSYPYDIAYLRWSGHGDNAVPDPAICEFVKDWNARYAWPKFVISSTSTAFQAFEKRYGDKLPRVRGEWSPYWEDGAGSSALETGLNRASSDRLSQAETVFAMRNRDSYPVRVFEQAWKNVLLYSEHTWGAYCSVTDPSDPKTREQWEVKQSYAATADNQSRQLLVRALADRGTEAGPPAEGAIGLDIYNTTSWTRTEVVLVPPGISEGAGTVVDDHGKPTPSQRLASGELAIMVEGLKPLSGRRYTFRAGPAAAVAGLSTAVSAGGATLDNGLVHVRIDEKSGGIAELRARGIDANLVDSSSGYALNDYLYLIGDDLSKIEKNGPVKITVRDRGPLVASLLVESPAPGCFSLKREVRVTAGAPQVELLNLVDKKRLIAASYNTKEGKESVNFAFPFHVPGGRMLVDLPIGAIHPESDLMPSACKNWLTAGRWADVANDQFGVTWATLDAPLVEVGGITANLLNSQTDPKTWRQTIEPTQRLYSWAMNNHWHTNYRAYQEGPIAFRYALRPHLKASPAEASRFAVSLSQPLIPTPARGPKPPAEPLLTLSTDDVIVTALKPSDDGKATVVRLYGASGRDTEVTLAWGPSGPMRTWLSDTSERPLKEAGKTVSIPAWGVVTLRAE
jgi:alpha-mannosidase